MSRFHHPRFSPPPRGLSWLAYASLLAVLAPPAARALTFSAWQATHFTPAELADSTLASPLADADADGLPNLHEYHFGADPRLSDSTSFLPALETIEGSFALRYRHALAAEDSLGWLQASPDLVHWVTYGFEAEVARTELPDTTEITLADLESFEAERRFLRLRVDLAPFDFSLRAPSGLTLTLHNPTQWELGWNDLNLAETAYEIERQSSATGLWLPLGNAAPNQISWFHDGADSAAGIHYRVVARDAYGNTLASEPISPPDTDGDGLPDALELSSAYVGAPGTYSTSPNQASDPLTGILDIWAPLYGYSGTPGSADGDDDGLSDLVEAQNHLNPFSEDTDRDGRTDTYELENGQDPLLRHSPYLVVPVGPNPVDFSPGTLRVNLFSQNGLVHQPDGYAPFADFQPDHASQFQVFEWDTYSLPPGNYGTYRHMGSTGLMVVEARDYAEYTGYFHSHYQLLVWPGDENPPFRIKGPSFYNDQPVGEGAPAVWHSSVRLLCVDLLGRVWCIVNNTEDAAYAPRYELRCYLPDGTYTVHHNSGPNTAHLYVCVLQSNGTKTIGYFNDYQNHVEGPFVGEPHPDYFVDYLPLALNRRGDVLGDAWVYAFNNAKDIIPNHGVLDAERTASGVLQNHLGSDVYIPFVVGNDEVRHYLPMNAAVVTGFDEEANVYGREVDGRPVVWMADPEAWGHPSGTPRYTAAPYVRPVLPTGLKPLVNVRPNSQPHPELVQVGWEHLEENGLGWGHLLLPASLAVDYNRDGTIDLVKDTESDATSRRRVFRFWSNDDDDGDSEGAAEVLNSDTKDYETTGLLDTNAIKNIRDLEDFARLWIYTQGLNESFKNGSLQLGLKWANVTGSPKINLYKAYEADGGDQYLKNPAIAAEQIQNEYDNPIESVSGQTTVEPGPTFVFEQEVFANLSEAQPKTFFIFEGAGEGKGQLKMVILKDGMEIGEGPGVWFDLVNVKSMYERAVATATFSEPWNYAQTGNLPAFSVSVAADPQGHAFQQPVGETKESLVFVHGWKMDAEDVRSFAETMFKRLWWEGYKGRFRVFRWPTYTGDYSFSDSEFMAWKCGSSLKSYIEGSVPGASLPSDYTKCVAAHSLGNVVAGSALKQGLVPDRYFVMQGAIPSGCYDTSDAVNGFANPASASSAFDAVPSIVVLRSMFSGGESGKSTPDNDSPDWGYRGFLVGASAGKVVNFCNPRDFALTTGSTIGVDTNWLAWQFGYKPRDRTISGDINFEYRYTPTATEGQRLKLYRYTDSSHDTVSAERLLADAHESMGFLARTRSLPIGADTQAGGIVDTTVNLQATYGFTDSRGDHSGQFGRTIHGVRPFYKRIVQELE